MKMEQISTNEEIVRCNIPASACTFIRVHAWWEANQRAFSMHCNAEKICVDKGQG